MTTEGNSMDNIRNLKILCVEDDGFALEEMTSFLRKRVDKVYSAVNGADGIEQYEIYRPDIIIADILMPEMYGIEMIRRMKEERPGLHVIMVTSVNALDKVLESVDMGIDGYIIKPVEFSELEKKLVKVGRLIAEERKFRSESLLPPEERKSAEDTIKKEFIKVMKAYMGKGPRETIVHMRGKTVKLTILDSLTVMEENQLKDIRNFEMVRQNRSIAYSAVSRSFCTRLSEILGVDMKYDKVEINLKMKRDTVTFVKK